MSPSKNPTSRASHRRQATKNRRRTAHRLHSNRRRRTALEEAVSNNFPPAWDIATLVVTLLCICIGVGPGIVDPAFPIAGDQVTHNWWLVEFRDRLFGSGSILGWSDALSLGYPFGYFYFPLPPLIFSALSILVPDAISIKFMVLGSLCTIPVGAWQLVKALGMSRIVQAATPLFVLAAIFSSQKRVIGGTLYATLTGEFSYAYGLGFALLAIASSIHLITSGQRAAVAGVFTALSVLSHVQAAIPAVVMFSAALLYSLRRAEARRTALLSAIVAIALSAWWVIPAFTMRSQALGDGHRRETSLVEWLTHLPTAALVVMGCAGILTGILRRRPGSKGITLLALSGPAVLIAMPGSFFWNVRVMPWTYIAFAIALGYLVEPAAHWARSRLLVVATLLGCLSLAAGIAFVHPDNRGLARAIQDSQYGARSFPATDVLSDLADRMSQLPPGPAMLAVPPSWVGYMPARDWVTSLPLLTDGNITSPITLYYEASRSTPSIEYTHAYVSQEPHTSLSWLAYNDITEFAVGVEAMKLHGVKYYIVGDQTMYDKAAALPGSLRLIDRVGEPGAAPTLQWAIFEVAGSTRVEPVAGPIEVVPPLPSERAWARAAVNWLDAKIADPSLPYVLESGPPEFNGAISYPNTEVSNVSIGDDQISFTVQDTDVPIIIRASYSPNWQVSGAEGPWRASPNFMVVRPTETTVVMTFHKSAYDIVGMVVSLALSIGLGVCALTQIMSHFRRRCEKV